MMPSSINSALSPLILFIFSASSGLLLAKMSFVSVSFNIFEFTFSALSSTIASFVVSFLSCCPFFCLSFISAFSFFASFLFPVVFLFGLSSAVWLISVLLVSLKSALDTAFFLVLSIFSTAELLFTMAADFFTLSFFVPFAVFAFIWFSSFAASSSSASSLISDIFDNLSISDFVAFLLDFVFLDFGFAKDNKNLYDI